MLQGKKTYTVAIATILATVAGALAGQIDVPSAAQLIVTSILGMTIRKGVTDEVNSTK